jgi:hypothetical protein
MAAAVQSVSVNLEPANCWYLPKAELMCDRNSDRKEEVRCFAFFAAPGYIV